MMGLYTRGEYTPIGLDIENGAICAVQFRRTRRGLRLHAAAASVTAYNATELNPVDALRSLLESGPFVGRDVVSAISNTQTDVRPIQLPKEIDHVAHPRFWDAVRMEASSCLIYSPDEAVLDYLPLHNERGSVDGVQLLLIASRKEYVNRHLALLRAAGLRSRHLDVGGCAAARFVGRDDESSVIVDYGPECTSVTMALGKQLVFSRTLRTGHRALTTAVTKGLGIDAREAVRLLGAIGLSPVSRSNAWTDYVAQYGRMALEDIAATMYEICYDVLDAFSGEIRRTLEYFSAQRPDFAPEEVVLAGPLLPLNIEHCLSSKLSLPIKLAESISAFSGENAVPNRLDPAYVVAAGLAMRGEAA